MRMRDAAAGPAAAAAATAGRRIDDRVLVLCGLAWAAGLIHVQAALSHLDVHPVHALLFELVACAQLAWGVALYRRPTRRGLLAGAVGSLAVAAVWALSRTVGVPGAWSPEAVGAPDLVATAGELLTAAVALALARRRDPRSAPVVAAGVVLVLLGSLVLVGGTHAH